MRERTHITKIHRWYAMFILGSFNLLHQTGSWWWTGRPGVLWFRGSQRVRHEWAAELYLTEPPSQNPDQSYLEADDSFDFYFSPWICTTMVESSTSLKVVQRKKANKSISSQNKSQLGQWAPEKQNPLIEYKTGSAPPLHILATVKNLCK